MKTIIFAFLLLMPQLLWAGHDQGGGGDAQGEMRFDSIRNDLLKWLNANGGNQPENKLKLPDSLTYRSYQSKMQIVLAKQNVIVTFVTAKEEVETTDKELKVSVDGKPKSCRGFISEKDNKPHIVCNTERFFEVNNKAKSKWEIQSDQYRLVHHEYAGLAGVEKNVGAASDYEISQQITDYLVPKIELKLAVKKPASKALPKETCTYIADSASDTTVAYLNDYIDLSSPNAKFQLRLFSSKSNFEILDDETEIQVSKDGIPVQIRAFRAKILTSPTLSSGVIFWSTGETPGGHFDCK